MSVVELRPWGSFEVLAEGPGYKVKRITVLPGHQLSLQYHHRRSEHWVLVVGEGEVTKGEERLSLQPNESVSIPSGCRHRIRNPGANALVFIEIQFGDYLDEDDIVRIADDYHRLTEHRL